MITVRPGSTQIGRLAAAYIINGLTQETTHSGHPEYMAVFLYRTGGCRSRPGAWTEIIDPFGTFSLANKSNNLMMA